MKSNKDNKNTLSIKTGKTKITHKKGKISITAPEIHLDANEEKVIEKVDEAIISVSEEVQKGGLFPHDYAETVKGLAALVEARAKLI